MSKRKANNAHKRAERVCKAALRNCAVSFLAGGGSKYADFKLIKHPMFGKAIVKQYSKDGVTVLFCAKDMRSV